MVGEYHRRRVTVTWTIPPIGYIHTQGGHLPKIPGGMAIAYKVENALKGTHYQLSRNPLFRL